MEFGPRSGGLPRWEVLRGPAAGVEARAHHAPQGRELAVSEVMSVDVLDRLGLIEDESDDGDDAPAPGKVDAHLYLSAQDLSQLLSPPRKSAGHVLDLLHAPLPMSSLEAYLHLLKSNLGAGCLALPLVFSRASVPLGAGLLCCTAMQGTYSMLLLVRLKRALADSADARAKSRAGDHPISTFEDLGLAAFGLAGKRAIELFVVALQLGICCVYISLVSTNLHAGLHGLLSPQASLCAVTGACALLSLLRDLTSLWPLSTAANVFMLTACVTAVTVAALQLAHGRPASPRDAAAVREAASGTSVRDDLTAAARCLGALFFAIEGLALVLPVEIAVNPRAPQPQPTRPLPRDGSFTGGSSTGAIAGSASDAIAGDASDAIAGSASDAAPAQLGDGEAGAARRPPANGGGGDGGVEQSGASARSAEAARVAPSVQGSGIFYAALEAQPRDGSDGGDDGESGAGDQDLNGGEATERRQQHARPRKIAGTSAVAIVIAVTPPGVAVTAGPAAAPAAAPAAPLGCPPALRFERVLLASMFSLCTIYMAMGVVVALGFPDIDSGSVSAFLAQRDPSNRWLAMVNAMIGLAILCTFPLQMQPALMVLDKQRVAHRHHHNRHHHQGHRHGCSAWAAAGAVRSVAIRFGLVGGCVLVVLLVPELELLIALLGALCQASLSALPFLISLTLHARGAVRISASRAALHVGLLSFCILAATTGSYSAFADIASYLRVARAAPDGAGRL
ncbi:hypothetical protein KFE25_011785 [Diacronema lutheri]|uniref:Amino acid transporter transmembrane domain-containing protein n=1 Tax=Diacronema lutheri TaxID=2081491 RepID=A0A8J5XGE2_DIALT|nr:hypothetical protein KFE25_011785 [Diacronema lutheri]